jgi:hypothetical protein
LPCNFLRHRDLVVVGCLADGRNLDPDPGDPAAGVRTGPIGGETSRRRILVTGVTNAVSAASLIAS